MEHLFAYGSLMCDDIMLEVSGYNTSPVQGILKGYCRRTVNGEHYPAIVPDEKSSVPGVVYLNVPESAWERLDRFEGDMYARERVQIDVHQGETLYAATYVLKSKFKERLGQAPWSFEDFLRHGKAHFQRHYQGYHAIEENNRTQ